MQFPLQVVLMYSIVTINGGNKPDCLLIKMQLLAGLE